MERLTEWFYDHWGTRTERLNGKLVGTQMCLDKLASYEDKEEQGLLIELPCKVGDTVWQIHTLPKTNRKVIAEVEADAFFITLCVLEGRFGKTVFLTRSEAEEALARMKGEDA